MRGGHLAGVMAAAYLGAAGTGCVSLNEHNRLKAAHRMVLAEKEQLGTELYDERNVNDSLRTRVAALEREVGTKDELLTNLRSENNMLDQMRRMTQSELERAAGRIGDITIEGTKLPPQLDTVLKRFADEHPTEVVYDPRLGTVKWKADLLFPLGSDVVKDTSMDGLRGFTDILKSAAAAGFEVIVVGHTDTVPIQKPETRAKHPTNWHLSAHRAIAVGNVLQKFGYPAQRIGVMGCSEFRPVADNGSESGKSQNRRVEIYLVPTGSIVAAVADSRTTVGSAGVVASPTMAVP